MVVLNPPYFSVHTEAGLRNAVYVQQAHTLKPGVEAF